MHNKLLSSAVEAFSIFLILKVDGHDKKVTSRADHLCNFEQDITGITWIDENQGKVHESHFWLTLTLTGTISDILIAFPSFFVSNGHFLMAIGEKKLNLGT